MKTFEQYLNEINRPGEPLPDRTLEAFPQLLQQMMMNAKGVLDPQTKQQLYQILNPFNQQMTQFLQSRQQTNQGFSPRYQNPMQQSQINPNRNQ